MVELGFKNTKKVFDHSIVAAIFFSRHALPDLFSWSVSGRKASGIAIPGPSEESKGFFRIRLEWPFEYSKANDLTIDEV